MFHAGNRGAETLISRADGIHPRVQEEWAFLQPQTIWGLGLGACSLFLDSGIGRPWGGPLGIGVLVITVTWKKVVPGPVFDGLECWEWTGQVNESRYGRITRDKKHYKVHRLAWVELFGEIPEGLSIDHLCQNTVCCNPYHMDVVPTGVNTARRWERMTHCKRGHLRSDENMYVRSDGQRECRPCKRLVARKWYNDQRAITA